VRGEVRKGKVRGRDPTSSRPLTGSDLAVGRPGAHLIVGRWETVKAKMQV